MCLIDLPLPSLLPEFRGRITEPIPSRWRGHILPQDASRVRIREVLVGSSEPTFTLLQRVAQGEPGATQECLDRFGGLVWSLARRLASNDSEAEDAVQEIFIDVWRSSGRYDPSIASETAFVAMIARRRLIDQRRKSSRRPEVALGEMDPASETLSSRPAVCEEATRAAQALDLLSDEQRRVLRLSIMHGLSHEKIARSTGLPLGTVKTHARRGLIKVRQMLAESNGSNGASGGTSDGGESVFNEVSSPGRAVSGRISPEKTSFDAGVES